MSSKCASIILTLLLVVPFFVSCGESNLPVERLVFIAVDGTPVPVEAEIARTQKEQATGLMWREELADGKGMLFWYNVDTRLHFWMKNTPIPLSIAYIDSSGTIREIFDMKPQSLSTVSSTISVRYALEVPAGWFEWVSLEPGCRLDDESLERLKSLR